LQASFKKESGRGSFAFDNSAGGFLVSSLPSKKKKRRPLCLQEQKLTTKNKPNHKTTKLIISIPISSLFYLTTTFCYNNIHSLSKESK